MRSRAKMIGAAIGGAAVLASGAYALGAQSGNGDAEAAAKASSSQAQGYGQAPGADRKGDCGPRGRGLRFRGGPGGAGLADQAKKLGVSEAKLRSALEAVRKATMEKRKDKADDMRDAFATALAKELGISKDKVESALPKGPFGGPGHMGHGGPPGPPPAGGYGAPPTPPAP